MNAQKLMPNATDDRSIQVGNPVMSERRQFKRIPMGAEISFQELNFSKIMAIANSVYKDVSGGGLLIVSSKEYCLGTLLKLELRVPGWGKHQVGFGTNKDKDQRPLVAVGQVVRVEQLNSGEYEIGIKFLNVYPDDLVALLRFIEAASPAVEQ